MKKIEALNRPLKVLFVHSAPSVVATMAKLYPRTLAVDDDVARSEKRLLEVWGTVSLYLAKRWLGLCNMSGIEGKSLRRRFINDEKYRPLQTPYPFDVLVCEFIGERQREQYGMTTPELLRNINELGLHQGFYVERGEKTAFRPPLSILCIVGEESPRSLKLLMEEGVRGTLLAGFGPDEFERAIVSLYDRCNPATQANFQGGSQLRYEDTEGKSTAITLIGGQLLRGNGDNPIEVNETFLDATMDSIKALSRIDW
jgi:hypothetical protein